MNAKSIAAALVFSLLAASAAAQNHSSHGAGYDAAPLPPPPLMAGIGSSEIKITTRSAEAQRYFNQGLRLLHCFWDFEAYRAFRQAARLDESAAMAHWGIYVALQQNGGEMAAARKQALEKAVALSASATEREQMYIRAATAAEKDGRAGYIREMEALIDRYPEEIDAQLFLARTLSAAPSSYDPDGRPRDGKVYGQMILQALLARYPENAAVHHYWIHAVENGPNPARALASAEKLPKLAPAAGHMIHMAGHIFYRIGQYARARAAFEDSLRVDAAYMKAQNIAPVNNWNYFHNLDYLIGNCAEDGRYREGLRRADELYAIPVEATRRMAQGLGYLLYGGFTARARLQIRYGFWSDAAQSLTRALEQHAGESTLALGYLRGLQVYAAGMGAVAAKQTDAAEAQASSLAALTESLAKERPQYGSDWYSGHGKRILEVALLELRGSLLSVRGQHAAAIAALQEAARKEKELGYWEPPHYSRPVLETLADVQLAAGDAPAARATWQQVLRLRPNSGHALLGIARTHARSGEAAAPATAEARAGAAAEARAAARSAYEAFLKAWASADRDLPQIREARDYLSRK